MAKIGQALLGLATGAANVINEDAEKDRAFMRKQKVKIADSRLVRQEREHDAKKAQWDMVQKYGADRKGQYMHAIGIFKDHGQAIRAVNAGLFADTLKSVKDPGTFAPYEIGLVADEEVRARYGDNSVAGKIMGAFGNTKTRRAELRDGQSAGRTMDMESLSMRADEALQLGDFAPVQDIKTVDQMEQTLGPDGKTVTTTQHEPQPTNEDAAAEDAFFTLPNISKIERDGDQLITTISDPEGNLVSSKATAIDNYKTWTRPEVDLKKGIATWSSRDSKGNVETFAGKIQGLPEDALKGFEVVSSTYNAKAGGYTILEQNDETNEFKTTFLAVGGVPEGQDQSKLTWMTFTSIDPATNEQIRKYVATEIVGTGTDRKIQVVDSIQVTTATETSGTSQPAPQFNLDRSFSLLADLKAGGGDAGQVLDEFSDDQLRSLSVKVADQAKRMATEAPFSSMDFREVEKQAALRELKAEALRQELRAAPTAGTTRPVEGPQKANTSGR